MRAYRKNDDGSLEIVSVGITPDGVLTDGTRQLDPTGEVVDLMAGQKTEAQDTKIGLGPNIGFRSPLTKKLRRIERWKNATA